MTHQTLLLYAAGREPLWNASAPGLREPFAPTSLAMHFKKSGADGRWRYRERTIAGRTYRYFEDEGRAIGSVWADCPAMVANTPLRREATGVLPPRKPLKLLERIVSASSAAGATVIDPFCGSGTALAAAFRLGRSVRGRRHRRRLAIEDQRPAAPRRGRHVRRAATIASMSGAGEASLQPIFLKLEGRPVLVVGAGPVAERKVASLLRAGARVRVVAPAATGEVSRLAREGLVEWRERAFEDADADGAWLIVAATGDAQTQRRVAARGAGPDVRSPSSPSTTRRTRAPTSARRSADRRSWSRSRRPAPRPRSRASCARSSSRRYRETTGLPARRSSGAVARRRDAHGRERFGALVREFQGPRRLNETAARRARRLDSGARRPRRTPRSGACRPRAARASRRRHRRPARRPGGWSRAGPGRTRRPPACRPDGRAHRPLRARCDPSAPRDRGGPARRRRGARRGGLASAVASSPTRAPRPRIRASIGPASAVRRAARASIDSCSHASMKERTRTSTAGVGGASRSHTTPRAGARPRGDGGTTGEGTATASGRRSDGASDASDGESDGETGRSTEPARAPGPSAAGGRAAEDGHDRQRESALESAPERIKGPRCVDPRRETG